MSGFSPSGRTVGDIAPEATLHPGGEDATLFAKSRMQMQELLEQLAGL